MTNNEIFEALKQPFKPEEICWRIGRKSKDKRKAEVLGYIDTRAAMRRLDEVVGPENWEIHYNPIDLGAVSKETCKGTVNVSVKGFVAVLTLHLPDGKTVTKEDGCNCTDFEPFKGGLSGAFKRVCSAFGIGRYLYSVPTVWVPIDNYGNFKAPALPDWALPEGYEPQEQAETQTVQGGGFEDPFEGAYQEPVESAPAHNSDDPVFDRGKYRGTKVSECTDWGYMRWVVDKSNMPMPIKNACEDVLAQQPA